MNDTRLQRYLSAQADLITLTPADGEAVVRRGRRRRTQRRVGLLAAVGALAVGATSVAVYDGGDEPRETGLASGVVATPFDWDVIAPRSGLAYSRGEVQLADGSFYGLSTAPGPGNDQAAYQSAMYRSSDGKEWEQVDLPAGLKTSSLGAQGDTLYAIGTAPAGGSTRDLVLATSTDGAASWSNLTLPDDIAELEARFPEQIMIGELSVAAKDASHQIVTATIQSQVDPHTLIDDLPEDASWEITPDGIRTYAALEGSCADAPAGVEVRCAGDPADLAGRISDRGEPLGDYTWSELGVDPELVELIGGRTLVYVTDDGETFSLADLPGDQRGWAGRPLVADDGSYRLFIGHSDVDDLRTSVLSSSDGRTWTAGADLPGSLMSSGTLGGRPAVALSSVTGSTSILVEDGTGWRTLDLSGALQPDDGEVWTGFVAFGPQGVAADATVVDADGEQRGSWVLHSVDGQAVSAVPISDYIERPGQVAGITVSPDAVVVRVSTPDDVDPATPPSQTLLVGTPR